VSYGAIGHFNKGFVNRNVGIHVMKYEADNRDLQEKSWNILRTISSDMNYGVEGNAFDNLPWYRPLDKRVPILIVGNSHSKDLFNVLYNSKSANERLQIARYGIQIWQLSDRKNRFYTSPNYQEAQVILIATKYGGKDIDVLREIIRNMLDDNKRVVLVKNIFEFREFGWGNLADYEIHKLRLSKQLLNESEQVANTVNTKYYEDYVNSNTRDTRFLKYNEEIERIGRELNVAVLDRMDYVCTVIDRLCYAVNWEYQKYFFDYGHHTLEGAEFFGNRVDKIGWISEIVSLSHT
jgi:hypothetical protein